MSILDGLYELQNAMREQNVKIGDCIMTPAIWKQLQKDCLPKMTRKYEGTVLGMKIYSDTSLAPGTIIIEPYKEEER